MAGVGRWDGAGVRGGRRPRVSCNEHGVVVAHVPWARHDAGHTLAFDQTVAWLVTQCSKCAVTELMRIAWRTVGAIVARVWADVEVVGDRLDGLTRIGIDEIAYKRGYRYLTVVVDHDSGRLLWAAPGRDRATLRKFFDLLGAERSALITHVSADQADWIAEVVAERCPQAVQCADPFYADVIVMPMSWTPGRSCGVGRGREVGIIRGPVGKRAACRSSVCSVRSSSRLVWFWRVPSPSSSCRRGGRPESFRCSGGRARAR